MLSRKLLRLLQRTRSHCRDFRQLALKHPRTAAAAQSTQRSKFPISLFWSLFPEGVDSQVV